MLDVGVLLALVGVTLLVAGLLMCVKHLGAETAGVQVFKLNVSAASWLMLVVMGVAMIGTVWYFDSEHHQKLPASEVPLGTVDESSFVDSFPDEPFTFGDDAALDALWNDCAAGSMPACDDLYQESPVDSAYEQFGATCGNDFSSDDPPETCADLTVSTVESSTA